MQSAIDNYGEGNQLDMMIEEMSELAKAVCKYKRLKNTMELNLLENEKIRRLKRRIDNGD